MALFNLLFKELNKLMLLPFDHDDAATYFHFVQTDFFTKVKGGR